MRTDGQMEIGKAPPVGELMAQPLRWVAVWRATASGFGRINRAVKRVRRVEDVRVVSVAEQFL